jgi:hypothetical protein
LACSGTWASVIPINEHARTELRDHECSGALDALTRGG